MILGNLPFFKNLIPSKIIPNSKKIGKHINLSFLEVVPCYHISPGKNRESIFTYGLIPEGKPCQQVINYEPRIFISTVYDEASIDYVNYEDIDLWQFYLPKSLLIIDEFSSYANHYYTREAIPWYKLNLLEKL